jgi:cell division protein FtsB
MANDNLPAVTASDKPAELEMNDWLKKLKDNQDRKKEEKLRRYNDIISKVIIVLVALCVVSFIAVAALAVENNNLYRQNDQLKSTYVQNETNLNEQITKLTSDNKDLREFIFSNRTFNSVEYTVNMDPTLPKVSKITFNNNRVHLIFVDGTSKDVFFIDNNLYVNS